jgi:hypothetical protein
VQPLYPVTPRDSVGVDAGFARERDHSMTSYSKATPSASLALNHRSALAQDEGKPAASASQPAPAQTNQNSSPQNDMGRMMDRMGRGMDWDHRKVGRDLRMRRDDDDVDRDRDRGYRGSDRADREGYQGLLRRGSASASGESLLRVRKRRRILPIQRLTTIIRYGCIAAEIPAS